jgi:hypothetical protein
MMRNVDPQGVTHLDVAVTRQILVPGRIEEVFDFVAAEDVLPKILTSYGLVPGVASTSGVRHLRVHCGYTGKAGYTGGLPGHERPFPSMV